MTDIIKHVKIRMFKKTLKCTTKLNISSFSIKVNRKNNSLFLVEVLHKNFS